jgi:predicted nuclease of predicted toxin-antitoxin system
MDYRNIITIEAGKRGGKPTIRGMRITVYDALENLASGMTGEEILRDQNISPRLVERLQDLYPGGTHVTGVALGRASDDEVRNFAKSGDFMIVSKDSDFGERVLLRRAPPKVLWIRRGNCSTRQIEEILRHAYGTIVSPQANADDILLELF